MVHAAIPGACSARLGAPACCPALPGCRQPELYHAPQQLCSGQQQNRVRPSSRLLPAPSPAPAWQSLDLVSFLSAWLVPPLFVRYFHASALVFQFMYLWSKQNPEAQVGRGGG